LRSPGDCSESIPTYRVDELSQGGNGIPKELGPEFGRVLLGNRNGPLHDDVALVDPGRHVV
jgi:hypothetical protein